ncbi:MAG: cytochrome c [Acidobacteriota bacterium]|nr:cytochrome c [Acidobacteriota bacterium]
MRALGMTLTGVMAVGLMAAPVEAQVAPTFNEHVGAILFENCSSCHRPNQVAPMPLLSYADARPWARAIKAKVMAREMPPWFADPRFGTFSNDRSLSDEEIATIVEWVDAGAPQGAGPAPEPPRLSAAGWSHPSGAEPDYVIEFPFAWNLPADGETPNFNLYTPLPFDDVMAVSATQVRPGNYVATHHITTGLVNMPTGMVLGTGPAWPGGPMVDYVPVPDTNIDPDAVADLTADGRPQRRDLDAESREEAAAQRAGFGPYIPGVGADVAVAGQAREIRGDLFDYIIWNLHYQATGKPEQARPSIGAWLATEPRTQRVRSLGLRETTSEGEQLVAPPPLSPEERRAAAASRQVGQGLNPLLAPIPPNDGNWTVTGIGGFQNDAIIQSMFVHAHVRGKDFTWVLTYPDGREEVLLRVPNYDFDWQFEYQLAEPIRVPAGSTVKSIARYDNSRNNRRNPAPHKEVYWSEQSWDDMYLTNVGYTLAEEGSKGSTEE